MGKEGKFRYLDTVWRERWRGYKRRGLRDERGGERRKG